MHFPFNLSLKVVLCWSSANQYNCFCLCLTCGVLKISFQLWVGLLYFPCALRWVSLYQPVREWTCFSDVWTVDTVHRVSLLPFPQWCLPVIQRSADLRLALCQLGICQCYTPLHPFSQALGSGMYMYRVHVKLFLKMVLCCNDLFYSPVNIFSWS